MDICSRETILQPLVGCIAGLYGSLSAAGYLTEKIYPSYVQLGNVRIARNDGEYANLATVKKVRNVMIIFLTVVVVGGISGGIASGAMNLLVNGFLTHPVPSMNVIKFGVMGGSIAGVCFGGLTDPILRLALCIIFPHARETNARL